MLSTPASHCPSGVGYCQALPGHEVVRQLQEKSPGFAQTIFLDGLNK